MMVSLTKIRDLDLCAPITEGRHPHFSAASGLVCINSIAYVIADDELHLGVFDTGDRKPGYCIPLFPGALPTSKPDRKKQKPDFEVLLRLPACRGYPHGALLALGSGSRPNRRRGVILGLNGMGCVDGSPAPVDLSVIFVPLDNAFQELNIEGAVINGNELLLLQRGNSAHVENAIIRYDLTAVIDMLCARRVETIRPVAIHAIDLGHIAGIPLTFTDGAALVNGSMLFTAVAENTLDPYEDGVCAGAAIGVLDSDLNLRCLHRLDHPYKVEGVDAQMDGGTVRVLVVTDADNHEVPACLLSAIIPMRL